METINHAELQKLLSMLNIQSQNDHYEMQSPKFTNTHNASQNEAKPGKFAYIHDTPRYEKEPEMCSNTAQYNFSQYYAPAQDLPYYGQPDCVQSENCGKTSFSEACASCQSNTPESMPHLQDSSTVDGHEPQDLWNDEWESILEREIKYKQAQEEEFLASLQEEAQRTLDEEEEFVARLREQEAALAKAEAALQARQAQESVRQAEYHRRAAHYQELLRQEEQRRLEQADMFNELLATERRRRQEQSDKFTRELAVLEQRRQDTVAKYEALLQNSTQPHVAPKEAPARSAFCETASQIDTFSNVLVELCKVTQDFAKRFK